MEGAVFFAVYSLSMQPSQELCAQLLQNGQEENPEFAPLERTGNHLSVLRVYSTIRLERGISEACNGKPSQLVNLLQLVRFVRKHSNLRKIPYSLRTPPDLQFRKACTLPTSESREQSACPFPSHHAANTRLQEEEETYL